jgi:twinkle protein
MPPAEIVFPDGNDEVVSKGPCPKCNTEYGNVTYRDGHGTCYSCGHKTPRPRGGIPASSNGPRPPSPPAAHSDKLLEPGDFKPFRGLTEKTLRRFGYFKAGFKGGTVHVAPYYDQQGDIAGQKLRLPNKEFAVLKPAPDAPSIGMCRPYGHHVFGDRFDRKVVVCEGEIDAMSVAQVLDFKVAVVSINTGAKGAAKCMKANYLWLDRFQEIILWFDDDEPGQEAAAECADLFKVGKVRLAKAPGFKDANAALDAGKPGDIESAIYMATAFRPKGIVNAADNVGDVLAPLPEDETNWSYPWPWPEADEMLGPIRPGQVCYHVAGTGIGKTTGMAELEMNLLKHGCKIGHLGFEDTRRDVKLRLMSIHTSQRLDITPLPDADMVIAHQEVFGSRLVELFDPETAEWTVDAILGYVRYCAKALDCRVIVIDPLTFIAAGMSLGDDERRALDKASRDLAAMAKELGVHLQVAHHLKRPEGSAHEEGAATSLNEVRGSGGIANFATFVIGHERNQQAEGTMSLLTQLRALKNRPRSRTGPMVTLAYSLEDGRLVATQEVFPGPARKGGTSRERHAFPPHDPGADF